mmetsp:Transcript_6804/g.10703  ORF Transcript_6804/g.10703 Transcript_6804/m.10703 type:complete len:95 (-) Transcript_6804:426-710(-)
MDGRRTTIPQLHTSHRGFFYEKNLESKERETDIARRDFSSNCAPSLFLIPKNHLSLSLSLPTTLSPFSEIHTSRTRNHDRSTDQDRGPTAYAPS